MDQSSIVSAAMKIYQITNLNTYVLDSNSDFIYHHEDISIPAFMPGAEEEDVVYLQAQMQHNQVYSYTNEWGLHYIGYRFSNNEPFAVIIGPFMKLTPDMYSLAREYNLSNNESEELRTVCNQIQVLTMDKVTSFASIIQQFEILIDKEATPIRITLQKNNEKYKKKEIDAGMDEDAKIITMRYKLEGDIMHAVEQGDKSTALRLLNSNDILFSFSERFPNQPLRRVKNLAIVLSTLLRSAVIRSDVPAIFVHRVSDKYAYQIEFTKQLSKLQQLYEDMVVEYTDMVVANSLTNYSNITSTAIEYLVSYCDKPIDKNEIAELCFTHPSHLSRKFKQETDMTITGYQQMIRINKAKHLLKNESISIEEIAWLVGYEDSSYFSRVFKKETGKTPSQYREPAPSS
ncbi:helix-turn-helix transcriptional regulator [Virgibacillus sp. NKC19-16]|uniref:AraC family transcriptional regulator n=1 Tax=Virgibacillus salidurans TaxID=2831673 RepID=UPI001F31090C|nr:helix-turn-helix domain-containing protein [Virgibacillus sp. NKC19-16]UJL46974.1 helix-turn-helix transcriptional regulator [Virgibacillus sp. NKC19-16]